MKKCPFCAEEIQDDAKKCRYCQEFLDKERRNKWYHKTTALFIMFLLIGPFVLPFVWLNPRFSTGKKIIVSIIIAILSYYIAILAINYLRPIKEYYELIFKQAPF